MAPVFIATRSFAVEIDGRVVMVKQDKTRVAGDHELVRAFPERFQQAEDSVNFGVEQATAAPGEKRGAPPAEKPLEKRKNPEIRAYAAEHGIDLGDATTKEQMLEKIAQAQQDGE